MLELTYVSLQLLLDCLLRSSHFAKPTPIRLTELGPTCQRASLHPSQNLTHTASGPDRPT
jgi:hypothetical protein